MLVTIAPYICIFSYLEGFPTGKISLLLLESISRVLAIS